MEQDGVAVSAAVLVAAVYHGADPGGGGHGAPAALGSLLAGCVKGQRVAIGAALVLVAGGGVLLGVDAAAQRHDPQSSTAQPGSTGPTASAPTAGPPASARPRYGGLREQLEPTGVPASQVGKLLVNDTGDDLASWPRLGRGTGGTMTRSNGVLDLSTSGANDNGYSIISPNTYSSGIFEARIFFPGASDGKIADWPAFWLSSESSAAVSSPYGSELDLAEGLAGHLCVVYHYSHQGAPVSTTPLPVTSAPGWHVITGAWTTGRWDVYYDGKLVKTISGSRVLNHPMNMVLSAFTGQYGHLPGEPSTVKVSYLRVWSLASS